MLEPALLEALVQSAHEAAEEYRLADSRGAWLQVWRFRPSRTAACNIGELSRWMGDLRRAAEFLAICVRDRPKGDALTEQDKQHVLSLARVRQTMDETREYNVGVPAGDVRRTRIVTVSRVIARERAIVHGGASSLSAGAIGAACALVGSAALAFGYFASRASLPVQRPRPPTAQTGARAEGAPSSPATLRSGMEGSLRRRARPRRCVAKILRRVGNQGR